MKNFLLLVAAALLFSFSYAQQTISCDSVSLKTTEDIRKADTCAYMASDYVLSKPLRGNDKRTGEYRAFIIAWMAKSPDYSFSLYEPVMELFKDDETILLMGVYMACLTKAAIIHKTNFDIQALELLAAYVRNPENKVKQTGKLKKFLSAEEDGKLEKYLK